MKPDLLRFRCSSGHVLSKTKSVTPHFFYISDIANSSSFNGKIFKKKSMLEKFRANVLKWTWLHGFDSSHRPVAGTFDRFNGLSSSILLTLSCYFDKHKCPGVGHLNKNSQLSSNTRPLPDLPPQQLNIDRCIMVWVLHVNGVQYYIMIINTGGNFRMKPLARLTGWPD